MYKTPRSIANRDARVEKKNRRILFFFLFLQINIGTPSRFNPSAKAPVTPRNTRQAFSAWFLFFSWDLREFIFSLTVFCDDLLRVSTARASAMHLHRSCPFDANLFFFLFAFFTFAIRESLFLHLIQPRYKIACDVEGGGLLGNGGTGPSVHWINACSLICVLWKWSFSSVWE